jgi:hypothetical protein
MTAKTPRRTTRIALTGEPINEAPTSFFTGFIQFLCGFLALRRQSIGAEFIWNS